MLPHSFEMPAAVLLVLGGALTCFAGYRFFRLVLAVNGFIAGAAIASSMMAPSHAFAMVAAALAGGAAGALALVLAYFVGIALVGAALGAVATHLAWAQFGTRPGDPPWMAVIIVAVIGAIAAMILQRYVIVVGTAFGGAWMLVVGAVAVAGSRFMSVAWPNVRAADVWILYPFNPSPAQKWAPFAWIALGLAGMAVQLRTTKK
ncbi:MAG TPA: DUF4203 domain-containing protein [Vicinamibacterales bacterium]|jgi:hypothetical protein|nr:DUF4203 domain-containing protein [Vicinamibacterales bacterium]